MKVLIADDSALSRTLLKRTLQRWGYQTVVAEDGLQAWSILSGENPPPLAILDWIMPGMQGVEVCRKVRKERREPYTYILLLTSKNTKEETVEGMDSGADDYIVKPFHEHELQVRLRAGKRIIDLQIELMNAREQLRERADTDILTMLPNRPAILRLLDQEFARCHRDRRSVGMILFDLDNFKRVNDTYGHFAGDEVLRETAQRFRTNMRPYDVVGRYGGEEFLVVLPNSDLEQTCLQAERMRQLLSNTPMFVEGKDLNITASFGVTISDGSERAAEEYLRVADTALYMAKDAGRNRVSSLLVQDEAQSSASPLHHLQKFTQHPSGMPDGSSPHSPSRNHPETDSKTEAETVSR